jgi:large subunit ribosomal protein L30
MSAKKDEKKNTKTIRVRQVRSGIGCTRNMRQTLKALGLGKINRVAERPDNATTRGAVKSISHLVEIVA